MANVFDYDYKRLDKVFSLENSLKLVSGLMEEKEGTVLTIDGREKNVGLDFKKEKDLSLFLSRDVIGYFGELGYNDSCSHLLLENYKYEISNIFITKIGTQIKRQDDSYVTTGEIKAFIHKVNSAGFNKHKRCYYRAVAPIGKMRRSFHGTFETVVCHFKQGGVTSNCVQVRYGDGDLIATIATWNENEYFILDSSEKEGYESFGKKYNAFMMSLVYFTGYSHDNRAVFLGYEDKAMNCPVQLTLLGSLKERNNIYTPLHIDYGAIENSNKDGIPIDSSLFRLVSIEQLSSLFTLIYENEDFKVGIDMVITASADNSILSKACTYAVAMETLASFISKSIKGVKPIDDKNVWKGLKQSLLNILEDHELPARAFSVLKNKIQNLNAPPNADKLKFAFELLGIPLSGGDFMILKSRNQLLHGTFPRVSGDVFHRADSDEIIYYTALKFLTLLNMLILKTIGYSGYVQNHVYNQLPELRTTEPPYRQI